MTDEQIIRAVRNGTHTLVPMPVGDRKFYVGEYADADIRPDALVLILDLFDDKCEGEEMIGLMMGDLTATAMSLRDDASDDDMPF